MRIAILFLLVLATSCSPDTPKTDTPVENVTANTAAEDEAAIRNMMAAQVVEWNKGNVDGFMKGYWENDSLVFLGKSGATYGYDSTLQRYKKGYPDAAHMGKLTSTIVSLQRLSNEYYFVVGRWQLAREAGDVSGSYTLLIRKVNGEWVIINDHSS